MALLDDIRNHLAVMNPGQRERRGAVLLREAAAENERLKEAIRRLAEQDATLSLLCKRDGSCVVTVTMDAALTDEEREAIVVAAAWLQAHPSHHAATLRGLLERTAQTIK